MKIEKLIEQCIAEAIVENGNPLLLTPTGYADDWSRPVYKSPSGRIYVDVNCGKGEPSIHSVTDEGEPDMPLRNFKIAKPVKETSQPEPHDPETDTFQPSPRERTDEPKSGTGDRFRNLDNILPTIRSLYGEQPSIQDIVDFFSTRVREQAPSRLVRQVIGIFIKDNPNFFIILPKKLQEGKLSSLAMAGLLGIGAVKSFPHASTQDTKPKVQMADPSKELPSEKDMDSWDLAAKYSANKEKTAKTLKPMVDKYFGQNALREMVKEGVVNVLKESLSEGFDPQSNAGPNATVNDPGFYARMNAQMQKMEEDKGKEDPVAKYMRGYKTGRTDSQLMDKPLVTSLNSGDMVYSTGYYDGFTKQPPASPEIILKTIREGEHGRYAQLAGAGEFDPRTFGVNETK